MNCKQLKKNELEFRVNVFVHYFGMFCNEQLKEK